jgi:hypothetical protein
MITHADHAAILNVLKAQRDALSALIRLYEVEAAAAIAADPARAVAPPPAPANDQQTKTINRSTAASRKRRAQLDALGRHHKTKGRIEELVRVQQPQVLHPVAPVAPLSLSLTLIICFLKEIQA